MILTLGDYRDALKLDIAFSPRPVVTPQQYRRLLPGLVRYFARERGHEMIIPEGEARQRHRLKELLTLRLPGPVKDEVWRQLGSVLRTDLERRPRIDVTGVPTLAEQFPGTRYPRSAQTVLWRGDITTLRADAITNAANHALLGCFQPSHRCIDNAIHSNAGPHLRHDCHRLMELQGSPETAGKAKLTRAYHLPSRFVLHTVGPIVDGQPTDEQRLQLAGCYRACLGVCDELGAIESVAFCCISTGLFGFPQGLAAEIALRTVAVWRRERPGSRVKVVAFVVFRSTDYNIYQQLIQNWD